MEGGLDHVKAPFLSSNNNGERSEVTRLKCDFLSKLPDKVRCGLDPELSFHIDFSKVTGLTKGIVNVEFSFYVQLIRTHYTLILLSLSLHSD